jgi:hypothetical protein
MNDAAPCKGSPAAESASPPPELAVVIPTRNERENVAALVDRLAYQISGAVG